MPNYINIHTHTAKKQPNARIILQYSSTKNIDFNYFSYGIHPWDIKKSEAFNKKLAELKNCFAIGEIGLDRSITTPINEQKKWFIKQLLIAEELNKPIIIHCVRSYSDFLEIRKKTGHKLPWIFHGFNGNLDIAQKLIKNNCYLSFGKQLLSSEKLQQVFKQIPIDHLFFETDDADMGIEEVYLKASQLLGIKEGVVLTQIEKNFEIFLNDNKEQ